MTITPVYVKTETYPPNSMSLGYYKQCKLYCIIVYYWTIMMLMVYINSELISTCTFYIKTEEPL